jgi:hypothetical protein
LFDLVRHQRANKSIFLYAFDLIELNGDDLRRDPIECATGCAQASCDTNSGPGRLRQSIRDQFWGIG